MNGAPVLRVVTLNVYGRNGDWPGRREVLTNGLRNLRADLVALQETEVNDSYDQVADLLGDGWHVLHQKRRERDGTGMSLASRWPLGATEEVDLLVTERVRAEEFVGSLLIASVRAPDELGPLTFASVKPSFRLGHERERELQAVAAAARLEEVAGRDKGHLVLVGDFDASPATASMRFWTGLQSLEGRSVVYRDAWASIHPREDGDTFSPVNPLATAGNWPLELGRRIDYVLVRSGENGPTLRIAGCRRVFDAPDGDIWASDHFGVYAELQVPVRPPNA
jgi:endonuclease/exonuclease/phosphatase family metal-dependent hydrolase